MPIDRISRWYNSPEERPDAGLASAAQTASGTGPQWAAEDVFAILATLNVSAVAGTAPTLDLRLETTADDGATWYTVGSFAQQTAATAAPHPARVFAPVGQACRWAWTIAGTSPSVTFSVATTANRDD